MGNMKRKKKGLGKEVDNGGTSMTSLHKKISKVETRGG